MVKSILGSIVYGLLRQRAPLLFTAIDIANAVLPQNQPVKEIVEPEMIVKAKTFMKLSSKPSVLEIKKQYKTLARVYHPDKESGSEEKMKLLNMYYEELLKYYLD